MSLKRGPKIVTSGLLLSLDAADRNSYPGSGNSWFDLSGNNYNAAGANSPVYSQSNSGIINFTSANPAQRYQTTYNTAVTPFGNNTTWEAWAYCSLNTGNTFNMFMGAWLPYFGFYNANQIIFSNVIAGTQQTIWSSSVTTGTWYHICCTSTYNTGANTTTSAIYINGVAAGSGTFAGAQSTSSTTYFTVGDGCGSNINSAWYPFQGSVSNVKIYNRSLSTLEITQNFNALRGRFGI